MRAVVVPEHVDGSVVVTDVLVPDGGARSGAREARVLRRLPHRPARCGW